MMLVQYACSNGRTESTTATSPPANTVRVPSSAAGREPLTGASTTLTSFAARVPASARTVSGRMLLWITRVDPDRNGSASTTPRT